MPLTATSQVHPATNLTEIDPLLDPLWRAGISEAKINLGTAYYAHSYTLSSTSCTSPGCGFSAGGTVGNCSETAGVLYNTELGSIIKQYDPTIKLGTGEFPAPSPPSDAALI